MVESKVTSFFKNGGVFLLDEENYASEASFEYVEDLMSTKEGEDIYEIEIDAENGMFLFYDASVLDEDEALLKFEKGKYKVSL